MKDFYDPDPGCIGPPETKWQRMVRKVFSIFGIGTITVEVERVEIETHPIVEPKVPWSSVSRPSMLHRMQERSVPVAMKLECPECGHRHLDLGKWLTYQHKTHLCVSCKHEWRPFDYATVGV